MRANARVSSSTRSSGCSGEGKHIAVTVAEEQELLSPQQAADRLGFSRQHVVRLINAQALGVGELVDALARARAERFCDGLRAAGL